MIHVIKKLSLSLMNGLLEITNQKVSALSFKLVGRVMSQAAVASFPSQSQMTV